MNTNYFTVTGFLAFSRLDNLVLKLDHDNNKCELYNYNFVGSLVDKMSFRTQ